MQLELTCWREGCVRAECDLLALCWCVCVPGEASGRVGCFSLGSTLNVGMLGFKVQINFNFNSIQLQPSSVLNDDNLCMDCNDITVLSF